VADWAIVHLSGCITAGSKSVSMGNGQPLACAGCGTTVSASQLPLPRL